MPHKTYIHVRLSSCNVVYIPPTVGLPVHFVVQPVYLFVMLLQERIIKGK